MANFPKTRVLVGNQERFAELVSLQEKPDGTVTIVPKSAYRIIADDQVSKIKNEHISVHPSSMSQGTTIKTTIDSEKGCLESIAFVEDSQSNLVWPVFTRSTANLNNEDYEYKYKRPSEKKIVVFDKVSSDCSILYSVFAQRKGGLFPELNNFVLKVIEFKYFIIGIYITHVHVPPTLSSFRSTIVTSHTPIALKSTIIKGEKGVFSFPWFKLRDVLLLCCERVARIQTRIYLEEFSRNAITFTPIVIELMSREGALISKEPFNQLYDKPLASKFLPWICDPSKPNDSKEFNKALQLVFDKISSYNYFSDPFSSYEGEEIFRLKYPFRIRIL